MEHLPDGKFCTVIVKSMLKWCLNILEVILGELNVLSGTLSGVGKKRSIGAEYYANMKKNIHRVAQVISLLPTFIVNNSKSY